MAGLLDNFTNTLDNSLTGGQQANGQGGLLGTMGGVVNKTVDSLGNTVTQTVNTAGQLTTTTTD